MQCWWIILHSPCCSRSRSDFSVQMPSCFTHAQRRCHAFSFIRPRLISEPLASFAGMPKSTYRKPASPSKRRASRSSRVDVKGNRLRWERPETAEDLCDARYAISFFVLLVLAYKIMLLSFLWYWKWSHNTPSDGCDASSVNLHWSPTPPTDLSFCVPLRRGIVVKMQALIAAYETPW